MKRFLVLLCCALVPLSLMAQSRTGNIYGTVLDAEGNPLPGVSVTLTGPTISPIPVTSNAEGKFRFMSLFPSNEYVVKCELQGFKTRTETGIIVNVGKNSEITVRMEQGALQEQVTVIATTPVIEAKKTQITHTVNYEMLQELPTARDPWVVLQLTPSVQMDRENIGGVESGQQSYYQAKGSSGQEWTLDGMQITDRSSGSSPGYWDFDAFEELNISTGTLDVEHRDPGIVINIVTRRGGNKVSLGGRFYYMNSLLQATRTAAFLAQNGVSGYNHADDIKDFGFNAGGPIWKDKAWWWVAYGIQQISTINQLNVADKTTLNNYNGKINLQLIPSNQFEFLYSLADKRKFGRSSAEYFPPGWNQGSKYAWGNPTFKFQDEQTVGDNLFFSGRIGKVYGGFGLSPANDLAISKVGYWDVAAYFENNTYTWFYTDRPHAYGVIQAKYFNDNIMGTAHEVKVGFEYNNNKGIYIGGWPGNLYVNEDYNYPVMDWAGTGTQDIPPANMYSIETYRSTIQGAYGTNRIAAYIDDTITAGRFNINLGLRMDHAKDFSPVQTARSLWLASDSVPDSRYGNYANIDTTLFTPQAVAAIRALMPDQTQPYVAAQKLYYFFSPRIGVTYDLFGNGKTVLKASYTLYPGGYLGAGFWQPYGLGGWMQFWWWDQNNDHKASLDELYWRDPTQASLPIRHVFDAGGNFIGDHANTYGWEWSGFTWGSLALSPPTSFVDTSTWHTNWTHEVNVSVEKEIMKDFGVSLGFTWKKMNGFSWWLPYYLQDYNGNNLATPIVYGPNDIQPIGTVPSSVTDGSGNVISTGQGAGKTYYGAKPYLDNTGNWNGNFTFPTPNYLYVNQPSNRYNTYWGIDFVFTKRLADKWMVNGSFTYQSTNAHYGDGIVNPLTGANFDPTNNWAFNDQIYYFSQGGGSGKISQNLFSRWLFKFTGLYQLPFDINVSGTISAHEGSIPLSYFGVANLSLNPTGGRSNTIMTEPIGQLKRLPSDWVVNLKLEKMFRLGDVGRMYFSVDCFNLFNNAVISRRWDTSLGTFYFTGAPGSEVQNGYVNPYGQSGKNNEIMNPRIFRLGMRFQF